MSEIDKTRRSFLKTTSLATAAGVLTAAGQSEAKRKQDKRVIGANDRLRIGVIGVGGMGMAHVRSLVEQSKKGEENMEVVTVCDVYDIRLQDACKYVTDNSGAMLKTCKMEKDYRRIIEDADIDAVLIASPEHWHGKMAIEAMEMGKHVYLEKPMCREFEWAKKVYLTQKSTGCTLQVGSQICSDDKWRVAHKMVADGKIGHPVWSQTSYCRNSKGGEWNYPIDDRAKPGENLDWDMWLGHKWGLTPKRDWDPERYFRWRKYWDYSGGITHDLFPHRLHPFMIALGEEFPWRVAATGGIYVHKDREVPDTIHMMADYPSGHTVFMAGSTANQTGLPDLIRGHKGNMFFSGGQITILPETEYANEVEEVNEKAGGTGENITLHEKNWQKCIRTGETPFCHPDLALKVMTAIAMAEIAFKQNRPVRFDAERMRIIR